MIGRLRGTLVSLRATAVVLDVGGVGYEVVVTPRTVADLPSIGEEVVLHTHLVVREDALLVHGFGSESERDLFRILLTASGIGPKVAMAALGALQSNELRKAIAAEDVDLLTTVPGIGKRGAQRMVLELKPKLTETDAESVVGVSTVAQVRDALEGLGYQAAEIRQVMANIETDAPVADQLRQALRSLGRG
jgi:Holliday junction DNA helicase RuvA